MSKPYCGSKEIPPSGYRFGTLPECKKTNQIRRFGIIKADSEELEKSKLIVEFLKLREAQRNLFFEYKIAKTKRFDEQIYPKTLDLIRKYENINDHLDETDLKTKVENSMKDMEKVGKKIIEKINKINKIHDQLALIKTKIPANEIPPVPAAYAQSNIIPKSNLERQKTSIQRTISSLRTKVNNLHKTFIITNTQQLLPDPVELSPLELLGLPQTSQKTGMSALERLKKLEEEKNELKKKQEEERTKERRKFLEEADRIWDNQKINTKTKKKKIEPSAVEFDEKEFKKFDNWYRNKWLPQVKK